MNQEKFEEILRERYTTGGLIKVPSHKSLSSTHSIIVDTLNRKKTKKAGRRFARDLGIEWTIEEYVPEYILSYIQGENRRIISFERLSNKIKDIGLSQELPVEKLSGLVIPIDSLTLEGYRFVPRNDLTYLLADQEHYYD